jgi:hypothetical protein
MLLIQHILYAYPDDSADGKEKAHYMNTGAGEAADGDSAAARVHGVLHGHRRQGRAGGGAGGAGGGARGGVRQTARVLHSAGGPYFGRAAAQCGWCHDRRAPYTRGPATEAGASRSASVANCRVIDCWKHDEKAASDSPSILLCGWRSHWDEVISFWACLHEPRRAVVTREGEGFTRLTARRVRGWGGRWRACSVGCS